MKQERIGELFIVSEVILSGLFPILASYTTKLMPPLLFAGVSTLLAGLCLFLYILWTRQFAALKNKLALGYMLGATLFIAIIPQIFIFIGASKTSSINIGILWQTEILFTFLIVGFFYHEKITFQKIIGAITIMIGATTVLLNGQFHINSGDIFIIIGTAFFPIGNIFTKKAFALVTPSVILFVRSIIGGVILILLSMLFEQYTQPALLYIENNAMNILITGILIFYISKLLWYKGLKTLDISKAIPIGLSTPAFTLMYAFIFLKEIPTVYQLAGFFIIFAGLLILTKHNKHVIEMI